ncbi:MAG: hypothetical protein K8R39_05030 [Arcobacteraceae bacterium]|nr:hypothetical protein [Arcobacteraceae bacterium]
MKKVILVVLAGMMFLGCTKKLESNLKPYVTLNQNEKQNTKINFLGVEDQRVTQAVSTVLDEGVVVEKYNVSNNLKIWYREAFLRELKTTDMYGQNDAMYNVIVNIKKIEAIYKKDKLDKKNMQVSISLELVIQQGSTTTTSNITIHQTAYKMMVSDASDFEDILNEAIRDSVSKTVAILIKKVNNL